MEKGGGAATHRSRGLATPAISGACRSAWAQPFFWCSSLFKSVRLSTDPIDCQSISACSLERIRGPWKAKLAVAKWTCDPSKSSVKRFFQNRMSPLQSGCQPTSEGKRNKLLPFLSRQFCPAIGRCRHFCQERNGVKAKMFLHDVLNKFGVIQKRAVPRAMFLLYLPSFNSLVLGAMQWFCWKLRHFSPQSIGRRNMCAGFVGKRTVGQAFYLWGFHHESCTCLLQNSVTMKGNPFVLPGSTRHIRLMISIMDR